jgi:hypothetical protein
VKEAQERMREQMARAEERRRKQLEAKEKRKNKLDDKKRKSAAVVSPPAADEYAPRRGTRTRPKR